MTIFAPGKGQWVNDEKRLIEERIIPVNIACTEKQITQIVKFTMRHYRQEAVMYYKVSDDVFIVSEEDYDVL